MIRITTHVLDLRTGRPAAGMTVHLETVDGMAASPLAAAVTDAEGRVREWVPRGVLAGRYRLVFETGAWFKAAGQPTLYPEVVVSFEVLDSESHYHIPLLLSPYGYSTYRGS